MQQGRWRSAPGARIIWHMTRFLALCLLGTVPASISADHIDGANRSYQDNLLHAILSAEDARAATTEALAPIVRGLTARDAEVRRIAVRALGRMERSSLVPQILSLLSDDAPRVRSEAANALGQAVLNGQAALAGGPLIASLPTETDPVVLGAILRTLGRLPYESGEMVGTVEQLLVRSLVGDNPPVVLLGAARGLESLLRRNARSHTPTMESVVQLRRAARLGRSTPFDDVATAVRVRRLATAALVAAGGADAALVRESRSDPDVEVRRLSIMAARVQESLDERGHRSAA